MPNVSIKCSSKSSDARLIEHLSLIGVTAEFDDLEIGDFELADRSPVKYVQLKDIIASRGWEILDLEAVTLKERGQRYFILINMEISDHSREWGWPAAAEGIAILSTHHSASVLQANSVEEGALLLKTLQMQLIAKMQGAPIPWVDFEPDKDR